jgi:hypothetical protein
MLVLAYLQYVFMYRLEYTIYMYVSVYKNLSYGNQQKNLFETHIVKRNNTKKCFMK